MRTCKYKKGFDTGNRQEMVMTPLRLASLDCDIPVPNVYAERGTYSDIFEALFRKSAKTGLGDVGRTLELKITRFDAVRGELPTNEQLNNIDGIILTGSGKNFDNLIRLTIEFVLTECLSSIIGLRRGTLDPSSYLVLSE